MAQLLEDPKLGTNENTLESASIMASGDSQESTEEKMETDESTADRDLKDLEAVTCYCGKDRSVGSVELQCGFCLRFYHADCVTCYLGNVVPFMTSYQFFCKRCNPNGLESFTKKQSNFSQMCLTALANLQHEHPEQKMFSKDKDIIPYIDKNWEALTIMARRSRMKWHATISKTMCKESETFIHSDEAAGVDPLFALKTTDLSKIGPNYETLFRLSGAMFKTDPRPGLERSRGTKRKAPNEPSSTGRPQKRGEVTSTTKLAPSSYPAEHPFNKDGYRYVLAEPDPHAPNRQAFDESVEWAGKPIPGYLYRPWLGKGVLLAMHDRAPQLKLNDDRLTVTGEKGYSMIRGTHGVNQGSWYFEVKITDMPSDSASRIGWAQAYGNLQAPCGYDKFSYSWRSKKGSRFHESRGYHYSDGYRAGDVLGFYISLPEQKDSHKLLPPVIKDKPLVKFKSHLYFEVKDDVDKNMEQAKGSKLIMFRNGKSQGEAWNDIYRGTYYPTVSLYKNACVTCNFGPKFKHPPKNLPYKPMSDRVSDIMVEQALGDMLYHVDNEGQLPEF